MVGPFHLAMTSITLLIYNLAVAILLNMQPLPSSVNRSLGPQIAHRIKNLPIRHFHQEMDNRRLTMFSTFDGHFKRDPFSVDAFGLSPGTMAKIYPPLRIFFARYGGQSFNNGIYRVIGPSTLDDAADFVSLAFPQFRERAKCFAYDWMGRIFALDAARSRDGEPQMLMFEPDNALAFEVPRNLVEFHNVELPTRGRRILEAELHAEWLSKGGAVPRPNCRCVASITCDFSEGRILLMI